VANRESATPAKFDAVKDSSGIVAGVYNFEQCPAGVLAVGDHAVFRQIESPNCEDDL
jgi:hypothetical protein